MEQKLSFNKPRAASKDAIFSDSKPPLRQLKSSDARVSHDSKVLHDNRPLSKSTSGRPSGKEVIQKAAPSSNRVSLIAAKDSPSVYLKNVQPNVEFTSPCSISASIKNITSTDSVAPFLLADFEKLQKSHQEALDELTVCGLGFVF